MAERSLSYGAFWPRYLREHARPGTRALHLAGTGLGLLMLAAAAATGWWWLVPGALLVGYLFAWIGHAAVERNRPTTFTHPLWSLASDIRMFALWAAGRLRRELARNGAARR